MRKVSITCSLCGLALEPWQGYVYGVHPLCAKVAIDAAVREATLWRRYVRKAWKTHNQVAIDAASRKQGLSA